MTDLQNTIESAWERRVEISTTTKGAERDAVEAGHRDDGYRQARVAERAADGVWTVHQWLKKAVLLSFRLNDNTVMPGPGGSNWFDKVPSKFANWGENRFRDAGFRAVPGAIVRRGATFRRTSC